MHDQGNFRSFVPPLVQSVTFPYETFDEIPCPVYGRTRTPTNTVLEARIASLEGGQACLTAGSGSQALFNLIFTIARPGDNVVTSLNVFGEGYKQAATIFPQRCRVDFRFVEDPANPADWDANIDARTKLVWVETPSNPCLFVTDIRAVAEAAHARGVPLMVDNTTATAALQRPLDLGADMVLLSISKFMSGNATILGGAIVAPEPLVEDIRSICMHPPTITHEHMTPAERTAAGIDDGLIRLSVGLENPEDIVADLDQALAQV